MSIFISLKVFQGLLSLRLLRDRCWKILCQVKYLCLVLWGQRPNLLMFHTNPTTITKRRLDWGTLREVSQKWWFYLLLSLRIIFPCKWKLRKKRRKKILSLLCLNNPYRKASAPQAASIRELQQDGQQSLVSVYWEVNARWKLFFIQSLDVQLNHYICTLYYLLHMTQNICLILIRPMLFDH